MVLCTIYINRVKLRVKKTLSPNSIKIYVFMFWGMLLCISVNVFQKCPRNKTLMHPVGFEPTSTNTFELESNPLDRSGTDAACFTYKF